MVLTDKTALPPRCVRTNQPVTNREFRVWNLPWMPGWLRILMIVCPAFLLFAPFVIRRRCRLKAGISRGVKFRFSLIKLVAWVLILGAVIGPIVLVMVGLQSAAVATMVLTPFFVWGGALLYVFFSSPLEIARHLGDRFWIRGCSPAFLESLKESLGDTAPAAVP